MCHLGTKMVRPHNSGSAVRIVLQFCSIKGSKRFMKIILMVFLKKSYMGQFGHFDPKIVDPHNFGCALRFFFNFAQ